MWHSPVFISISPNRIPVKRINSAVVRNFKMEFCLPFHLSHLTLVLLKFIAVHNTNIKIFADVREQSFLILGVS
jgi:hypothetical protein